MRDINESTRFGVDDGVSDSSASLPDIVPPMSCALLGANEINQ